MNPLQIIILCFLPLLLVMNGCQSGDQREEVIHVAVASNMVTAMEDLSERFEEVSGSRIQLSSGSTGKHYAQIRNGAPYVLFFAADAKRPELLEQEGVALPNTRFTYAIGRIALWSSDDSLVAAEGKVLEGDFRHLAIANPKLAPYGGAATEVLKSMDLYEKVESRFVMGENIAQAFQFVSTGNADLGFVAYSQVINLGQGSMWLVPQHSHSPIIQQAVLLEEHPVARAFMEFVQGPEGRTILKSHGYDVP